MAYSFFEPGSRDKTIMHHEIFVIDRKPLLRRPTTGAKRLDVLTKTSRPIEFRADLTLWRQDSVEISRAAFT